MDLQLSGKVAIVTVASRGIGRAIAEVLSEEGMRLVVAARSQDLLREVELGVDRFGESVEIAKAVAFLASSASGYCQGAILEIDGGQTRTL